MVKINKQDFNTRIIKPKQINNIIININNNPRDNKNNIQVEIQDNKLQIGHKLNDNNVLEVNQKKLYIQLSRLSNSNTCTYIYLIIAIISILITLASILSLYFMESLYFLYVIESFPIILLIFDVYIILYLYV